MFKKIICIFAHFVKTLSGDKIVDGIANTTAVPPRLYPKTNTQASRDAILIEIFSFFFRGWVVGGGGEWGEEQGGGRGKAPKFDSYALDGDEDKRHRITPADSAPMYHRQGALKPPEMPLKGASWEAWLLKSR